MSNNQITDPEGPGETAGGQFPALHFDPAEYQRFVEDSDLTPAQQRELLEALWVIIVGFVDLGFGIHPVQQVLELRDGNSQDGHVGKNIGALESDSADVIVCQQSHSTRAKQDRNASGARPEG